MNALEDIPRSDQREGVAHPRFCQNIYGHEAALKRLADAASGKMHHAWLLAGPKGIGKASIAWRIARSLISKATPSVEWVLDGDPSVQPRIDALSEPRLTSITRPYDEKSKKLKTAITVDEVRKLKAAFSLSATEDGWRVVIIDAADELNISASNALLKLLEEPPAKTLFLLVCHQPSKLLPTIKSRTNQLRFDALSFENFSAALAQAGQPLGDDARSLFVLANGAPGQAIRLIEENGAQTYKALVDLAMGGSSLDRKALGPFVSRVSDPARLEITSDLFQTLIARMARFGALQSGDIQTASEGEAQLFARLSPNLNAAQSWAALHSKLDQEIAHAKLVNLDPSQSILDMFLQFEQVAKGVA